MLTYVSVRPTLYIIRIKKSPKKYVSISDTNMYDLCEIVSPK